LERAVAYCVVAVAPCVKARTRKNKNPTCQIA
jgi:hypothetical protein